MVYDGVKDLPTGEIVSYDTLSGLINDDIMTNRGAIYKARKKLLKDQKRFLVVERGEGFKIVEGVEIMSHAELRHEMAQFQVKNAGYEVSNINQVKLTPDEKKRLSDFMSYNANIKMAFVQTIDRIEKATQVTQIAQAFTESEVDKLRQMVQGK